MRLTTKILSAVAALAFFPSEQPDTRTAAESIDSAKMLRFIQ